MEIGLVLKVAGIGILVSILGVILGKMGRDDHVGFVSLAGILVVFVILIAKISELLSAIQSVFGLS